MEMQRAALATIELMQETYARIRSEEEKKKGLVILKALYGKLPPGIFSHAPFFMTYLNERKFGMTFIK